MEALLSTPHFYSLYQHHELLFTTSQTQRLEGHYRPHVQVDADERESDVLNGFSDENSFDSGFSDLSHNRSTCSKQQTNDNSVLSHAMTLFQDYQQANAHLSLLSSAT